MSTVFLHVGQAGCQLAQSLWPALAKERPGSPDIFACNGSGGPPRPRAVLVDSEPKVVQSTFAASGGEYAFDPEAAAWGQSGRGGNYALGYAGEGGPLGPLPSVSSATARPELVDQALECVRHQVERCHGAHLGTVVSHSLGGGTGSGLGTRLIEEVRDAFPESFLLDVTILPVSLGENPVQAYNALLALAALQELTDGVVLYENDRLVAAAERRVSAGKEAGEKIFGAATDSGVSLAAMNNIIARDLTPFVCPPGAAQPFDPGKLLAGVCPMPTHRFVQAYHGEVAASHGPPTEWKSVLDAMARSAPRPPRISSGGSVIAAQGIVRGALVADADALRSDFLESLGGPVAWQHFGGIDVRHSPLPLKSTPAAVRACALVNSKRTTQVIRGVTEKARAKYASRAFLHWYERYGFGPGEFAQAFETMDEVVANYEAT